MSPAPELPREEIERRRREAVEIARADMRNATTRALRAEAAARLRVAVQALMELTLHTPRS